MKQSTKQERTHCTSSSTIQSVAVIGLGPGGLAAVKECKAAGIETVVGFDAQSDIGGVWSPSSCSGVYDELTTNTSRLFSEFSDFPWRKTDYYDDDDETANDLDEDGVFPHHREVSAYLRAYATHNDLAPNFRLNTRVTSIVLRKNTTSGNNRTFLVRTVPTEKDPKKEEREEEEHEFDAVMYCMGKFGRAKDDQEEMTKGSAVEILRSSGYQGKILTSQKVKSVTDPALFGKDKKVLVIGGSVSGTDLCHALSTSGSCQTPIANSLRTPHYYLHKFSPNGLTLECDMFKRIIVWSKPYLPEYIAFNIGLKTAVLENNPSQLTPDLVDDGCTHLLPPKDIRKARIGFSSGYVSDVKNGSVRVRPEIVVAPRTNNNNNSSSSDNKSNKTIYFKDGSWEEFDVVICTTGWKGYDVSLFADEEGEADSNHVSLFDGLAFQDLSGNTTDLALYHSTLIPDIPNLAFAKSDTIGSTFPVGEMQARYAAALWAGNIARPDEAVIRAGAERSKKHRLAGIHNAQDVSYDVIEPLGDQLGVTPTSFEAIQNPSELLFGLMFPSYYRTKEAAHVHQNHENTIEAKKRYEWCKANPPRRCVKQESVQ